MLITEDMEKMGEAITLGTRLQRTDRLRLRSRDTGSPDLDNSPAWFRRGAQTEAAAPLQTTIQDEARDLRAYRFVDDGSVRADREARPQADVQTSLDPSSPHPVVSGEATVSPQAEAQFTYGTGTVWGNGARPDAKAKKSRVVAGHWGNSGVVTDLGGVSGAAAVGRSMTIQGQLKEAKQLGDSMVFFDSMGRQQVARGVQRVGKTSFYQVGPAWVQAGFDFKAKEKAILKIKPFSQAYFDLLKALPELSKSLALGDLLYLHHRGHHIVVVEDGLDQITKKQLNALKKPV